MSDTPDFDNMSPEEMMRWMESLAKRQGADPSSFTTEADMEVVEVSEDDERLGETGEYIPYGWTKEKWEAHLQKEAAEKASRAAQPPASIPDAPHDEEHTKPVYTPEPMAEPSEADDVPDLVAEDIMQDDAPDFDDMTPEEAMRWMESLAKRQGADPSSFLTEADLDVEEIAEDDERLQATGEYIPHGWTQEKWQAHLEKEAAEKASRQAASAKDSSDLLPSFDDVDDYEFDTADEDYEFVGEFDDDLTYEIDEDDLPTDFDEDNVIDLDDEDEEAFVMEEAPDEDEDSQPLWATIASGDEDDISEEFSLDDLTTSEDEEYDDEEEALTANNPMSWLQELAGDDGSDELDLSALEGIEEEQPSGATDPMGWLAELAQETKGDAVPDLQNLDFGDIGSNLGDLDELAASTSSEGEGENPIAWIESLARDQGAPSEELSTSADMPIERPKDFTPDGPGYEPYSFETGGKPPIDEDEDEPETYLDEEELEAIDMSDPSAWLDSLASGVAGSRSRSQAEDDDDDYGFDDEDDEELVSAVGESPKVDTTETMTRLNSGEDVSPEEMENFFDAMFRQAEQFSDRDEDFDDDDEEFPSEAIEADIPDWLQAQMAEVDVNEPSVQPSELIDEDMSPEEANAMLESLFGTGETEAVAADVSEADDDDGDYDFNEELLQVEQEEDDFLGDLTMDIHSEDFLAEADELDFSDEDLPDWLREDMSEDVSPDLADIFDEDEVVEVPSVAPIAAQTDDLPMATSDTWVEAFEMEADPNRQQELAAWYAEQLGGPAPAAATVQAAELPLERNLPLGEAQSVPEWMVTAQTSPTVEQPFVEVETEPEPALETDLPNWLTDEEDVDEIPDWLQTDSVDAVDAEDLPDWLNVDAEVELEDIPDWLRETMDEEEETIVLGAQQQPEAELEPEEPSAPLPVVKEEPAIVPAQEQRSPAPVPAAAAQIDVAALLQNARSKVSAGDVTSSLSDYETVIRANTALDEVVGDLQKLSESENQKKNPAVYRVLGDGLMRQGKLQTALETYRKALKML